MTRKELKKKLEEIRKRKAERQQRNQNRNQDFVVLSLETLKNFGGNTTPIIDPGDEFNPVHYSGQMATWSRAQIKEYEEKQML